MNGSKLPILIFVTVLAITSITCSLLSPGKTTTAPAAQTAQVEGTLAALQKTISSKESDAQGTAQAWMTQSASSTNEPGVGQPQLPTDDLRPGIISGALSYPSEHIPALRLIALNVDTGEYIAMEVAANTNAYQMEDVPPGRYQFFAYQVDASKGQNSAVGGYSRAVMCGLKAECTDHSLVIFEVAPDAETPNVDPGDWYAPAGSYPPDPTQK